jgi:hypothetical protein
METIKEHLSPAQFAKVTGILGSEPAGQEITAAWTGKENLRYALNLRARGDLPRREVGLRIPAALPG